MAEPAPKAASKAEPIPSTVVKRFYDKNQRLVREGTNYVYEPEVDKPYPWPLLRPLDDKLAEKLEAEYKAFSKEKKAGLAARGTSSELLKRLAAGE